MDGSAQKKLRRLPHVFSKVLELPFRSDADVVVEERPDSFRFTVDISCKEAVGFGRDIKAHAVEILPGVVKIVIRGNGRRSGESVKLLLDKLEVDTWRFRLPASTRPELAGAMFVNGELVITVPKSDGRRESQSGKSRPSWGGGLNKIKNRLVLAQ